MNGTNVAKRSTSADKTSIGFDYQFFYFISLLLDLKVGEVIGYEVKDDIHIELPDGTSAWMQLKHTLQECKSGKPVNLTEKDADIWKTLYNWCLEVEKKDTEEERKGLVDKTRFILVSNKSSNTNTFANKVKQLKCNEIKISEFQEYVKELRDNTGEKNKLKKYYSKVYSFNSNILFNLINKIEFNLDEDNLINRIRAQIESKFIKKNRVDDVLNKLVGELNIWKYDVVKGKGKLILNYEKVNNKFTRIFELLRTDKLPRRIYPILMPSELNKQTFIKELIEIGDISEQDIDEIVEYTKFKLKMSNHIREWKKENLIGVEELREFEKNCRLLWKNTHKECHDDTKEALFDEREEKQIKKIDYKCSRKCLAKCKNTNLRISSDDVLELDFSNGQFYLLSDEGKIGWKYDWKEKYNLE